MPALDQILQPISDRSNDGWTITPPTPDPDPGKVWPAITGSTFNDSSYVTSTDVGDEFTVNLNPGVTPGRGESGIGFPILIVRRRRRTTSDEKSILKATLLKGDSVVAVRYKVVSSTAFENGTDFQNLLTEEETNRLGDLRDLRLRVKTIETVECGACPEGIAPKRFTVDLTGVTNRLCGTCNALDKVWTVVADDSISNCIWTATTTSNCTGLGPDKVILLNDEPAWSIQIAPMIGPTSIIRYWCPHDEFDCFGLSVFEPDVIAGVCNWPEFVVTEPID